MQESKVKIQNLKINLDQIPTQFYLRYRKNKFDYFKMVFEELKSAFYVDLQN